MLDTDPSFRVRYRIFHIQYDSFATPTAEGQPLPDRITIAVCLPFLRDISFVKQDELGRVPSHHLI
jgi:hypothetical protein